MPMPTRGRSCSARQDGTSAPARTCRVPCRGSAAGRGNDGLALRGGRAAHRGPHAHRGGGSGRSRRRWPRVGAGGGLPHRHPVDALHRELQQAWPASRVRQHRHAAGGRRSAACAGHAVHRPRGGRRRAARIGLCDRLAPDEALRSTAHEFAAQIAASAPLAVVSIRQTLHGDLADRVRAATAKEQSEQAWLAGTADFTEGVSATGERREPRFTGS